MAYRKGSIEIQTDTRFKDNNKFDCRPCHPAVLPIASGYPAGEVYYLLVTSNVGRYLVFEDQYYSLADVWREAGLTKPSLINLQRIYKTSKPGNVVAGLPPKVYKDMIRKLKAYQDKNPDPLYEEIRAYL